MQRDNVLNKIIYLFYLETNDCSFFWFKNPTNCRKNTTDIHAGCPRWVRVQSVFPPATENKTAAALWMCLSFFPCGEPVYAALGSSESVSHWHARVALNICFSLKRVNKLPSVQLICWITEPQPWVMWSAMYLANHSKQSKSQSGGYKILHWTCSFV